METKRYEVYPVRHREVYLEIEIIEVCPEAGLSWTASQTKDQGLLWSLV